MSAARNDGKKLQQLVAFIEGLNLSPGFKIEKNRLEIDFGQRTAELIRNADW